MRDCCYFGVRTQQIPRIIGIDLLLIELNDVANAQSFIFVSRNHTIANTAMISLPMRIIDLPAKPALIAQDRVPILEVQLTAALGAS